MLKAYGKGMVIRRNEAAVKDRRQVRHLDAGAELGWRLLTFARPLSPDDQDLLGPLDTAYAKEFGLEPIVTKSSVSFYVRTGHAFVAVRTLKPPGLCWRKPFGTAPARRFTSTA